ncbi:MAG: hypothetical protein HC828_14760 [Blastochloris sp.]|nr:hypothetical protein [Blastochloris sp.]
MLGLFNRAAPRLILIVLVMFGMVNGVSRLLPNSDVIAYRVYTAQGQALKVMDVETGVSRTLDDTHGFGIQWSPNGEYLAALRFSPNGPQLQLHGFGRPNVAFAQDACMGGGLPSWSPDGAQMVFHGSQACSDTMRNIYRWHVPASAVNAPRSEAITDHMGDDRSPVWSPDGSQIAFLSSGREDSTSNDVYLMDADGANVERLTDGQAGICCLQWSPDSKKLLFTDNRLNAWYVDVETANR